MEIAFFHLLFFRLCFEYISIFRHTVLEHALEYGKKFKYLLLFFFKNIDRDMTETFFELKPSDENQNESDKNSSCIQIAMKTIQSKYSLNYDTFTIFFCNEIYERKSKCALRNSFDRTNGVKKFRVLI